MNDFIVEESHAIGILICSVLVLLIPFILVGIRKKLFTNFSYRIFIETLNRALYFEFIIALFDLFLIYILQKTTNPNNGGISLFIIELSIFFLAIFVFYIPVILILNIINYFAYRNKKIGSL